jgi:hypothetical protein
MDFIITCIIFWSLAAILLFMVAFPQKATEIIEKIWR